MTEQLVLDELAKIKRLIEEQNLLNKKVMTVDEAASFLNVTPSFIYKLTSKAQIPFSKPSGKLIYLKREDLESWSLSKPSLSLKQLNNKVTSFAIG